jgi:hypothetical protein
MSVTINACTFASDAQFHFVRVSVLSFIQHNRWFSGTIRLIIHPDFPLSDANFRILSRLYPNLSQVRIENSAKFIMEAKRNRATYLQQVKEYCKAHVFSLNESNLLYFSNSCLFMKDVAALLRPNRVVYTPEKSIFYIGAQLNLFDLFLQRNPTSIDRFLDEEFRGEFCEQVDGLVMPAANVRDTKFAQLSSQLSRVSCIFYNDAILNDATGHQRIKQVWLHKNKEVDATISSPRTVNHQVTERTAPIQKPVVIVPVQSVKLADNDTPPVPESRGLVSPITLFSYLNNKKIALVANSSALLEHQYGELIDSHDIVIRFNGYPIRPEHTGSKTNLHFIFRQAQFNLGQPCDYLFVLSSPIDPWTNTVRQISRDYPTKRIVNFNFPSRNSVVDHFGKKIFPTSGMCALLFIYSLKLNSATLSLFGFDAYVKGQTSILRANDDTAISTTHNYVAERKYFQTNFKQAGPAFLQKNLRTFQ